LGSERNWDEIGQSGRVSGGHLRAFTHAGAASHVFDSTRTRPTCNSTHYKSDWLLRVGGG